MAEQLIRVQDRGTVLTIELEEYLRAVVPAEMGALQMALPDDPDLPRERRHAEDVPLEALKAQAVAARSYALWRKAHPSSPDFDLLGDANDQVYAPSMIHPRSDEAVRETAGLHLVGLSSAGQYVLTCGLDGCPYCEGRPERGHKGHAWPGRMCQFGAHRMGMAGSTFRDILKHYYPDSRLSDEKEGA